MKYGPKRQNGKVTSCVCSLVLKPHHPAVHRTWAMRMAENHYVERFLCRLMEYRPKRQNGKVADCVYSLMLLTQNHINNRREHDELHRASAKWEERRKQESMAHWKQWSRAKIDTHRWMCSTDWSAWNAWETQKAFNKWWLDVKHRSWAMRMAENHYVERFLCRFMWLMGGSYKL